VVWSEKIKDEEMIYQGDCLDIMPTLPDKSIDLTVTSPPYDNLRTYNGSLEWNFEIFQKIAKELFRVTKDSGVIVWIVGDATINGSETGTSFKQALYFKEIGFNLHDTMIWNKGRFSAIGALATRYAPVFEYMFIFVKGKIKIFNPLKDKKNKCAGKVVRGTIRQIDGSVKPMSKIITIAEYGQRFNIWDCVSECVKGHPAPFPLQLATDHILSWSNEGDIILDPFAGSGMTGVACKNTNRKFILIEKEPKYFEIIKERLKRNESKFFGN